MNLLRRTIIVALLVLSAPLLAQEKPQEKIIGGQVRLRSELDDRGVLAGETVATHLLRSRIRATMRPVTGITLVAEVQDARYWGQGDPALARGTTDASADGLDMHLAWAQIDSVFALPVNLRVGRQELSFANERLVGVSNWSNTGRSFDAARARLLGDGYSVDLFASRLTAPSAGPIASQNLYGLWGAIRPATGLAVDLFGLRDDNTTAIRRGEDTGLAVLERYTFGTYVRLTADPIDAEVEGIMQTGNSAASDSAARREIGAFLASATVGVMLLAESTTRLYLLGTVLSGDGASGDDRAENFNTLFGTNHRFYGNIDIAPEAVGGSAGLVDLSAGVTTSPAKGLRMVLEGHLLKPQRTTTDAYGTEVDLTAFWRANPAFELSGGAAVFVPGPLAETRLGGADPRFWAYISGQFDF